MQNIPSIIIIMQNGTKKNTSTHTMDLRPPSPSTGCPYYVLYICNIILLLGLDCVIPIQYRLLSSGGHYKISGLLGSGKGRVDHTSFDVRLLPYLSACCSFVDSLLLF